MTSTDPQPRLTFLCPDCKQLIARMYTAAQLEGARMPVLRHRAVSIADDAGLQPLSGSAGNFSANTAGLRDKGFQNSYVADHQGLTPNDIAVACRCGGKFSVRHGDLIEALADNTSKRVLPTRHLL